MKPRTRKWLVLAALAGFFATAPTAFAQGHYGSRAADRVDIRQDRRHLRRLNRHIVRDQRHLQIARRKLGRRADQREPRGAISVAISAGLSARPATCVATAGSCGLAVSVSSSGGTGSETDSAKTAAPIRRGGLTLAARKSILPARQC